MAEDDKITNLETNLAKHLQDQNWGLYRNTLFEIGEVFRKEGKRFQALWKFFEVCYLDLNGPKNYGALPEDLAKEFPAFEPDEEGLASGVLDRIDTLVEEMKLSRQDARALFDEAAKRFAMPQLPVSLEAAWERMEAEIIWEYTD